MDPLAATQRRIWRLLTAPEGVRAALAASGDPEGVSLRGWVRGDAEASAALRLEVYANAYFGRIRDALAGDYGALAAALGEAGFHDLVTAYLLVHPPRHPSLRRAGSRLAGFLASDDAAAPFRRRWPFAAELARLETALVDAFDARDTPPLDRRSLAGVPAGDWVDLRLALHPAARLVPVTRAVDALRAAYEAGAPVAGAAPERPGTLAVWRWRERPLFRRLDDDEADALAAIRAGGCFGDVCDRVAARAGVEGAPARAAALLGRWVDDAMLVGGADG